MDELLILVPVRIHFPLQSIGLKTLDHFMGNNFFCNYVTFDFLLPLKLPVGHVAERRFKRLNEPPQADHLSSMQWRGSDLSAHMHSPFNIFICSHLQKMGEERENIWVNKIFMPSVLKNI